MAQIQTTGKFRVSNGASMGASFGTLPTAGHTIIVRFWGWFNATDINWQAGDVTDNQGNTYTLVVRSGLLSNNRCAIFYCQSIGTPSGTFTITVNPQAVGNFWGAGVATEETDITGVDVTTSNTGTSTTPSTGTTAATAQADELVIACCAISLAITGITVNVVSPAFTEDAEELSFTNYLPGEADSRVVSAIGTQTCGWVHTINSGPWTACIATFTLGTVAPSTTTGQGTFVKPTITGPQAVLGVGFMPKALVLWTDGQAAAGTTDGVQFSLGMTDGLKQCVRAVNSADNVAASETTQAESNQRCIWLVGSDETTQASASLVSFDADGFTITWDTSNATASVIHYLAFGGDAIDAAKVDHWTVTGSSQSVTTVGFYPAAMLCHVSAQIYPATELLADFGSFSGLGFVATASLANSTSVAIIRDNQNPSDTYKRQRTDKSLIVSEVGLSGGAPRLQGSITAALANGFTATYDTVSGDAYRLSYLAVRGCQAKVFTFNQPAGTGTQTISGIGFRPRSIMLQSVGAVSSSSTGNGAQLMLGSATGSKQSVAVVADNDNVTPTVNARSHATDKVIRLITPTATGSASTVVADAAFTAFTSDGFTLNWVTTDATAREFIGIAFGDAIAEAPPVSDPGGGGTVGAGTDPNAGVSLCPVETPLAWLEITPAGSATTYRYSKVPINIDGAPKFARVASFGTIRRALSNDAGDFRGVSVDSLLIDKDRVLRGLEDADSLIGARASYYISSEAAIRAASTPRRVFDGVITDCEPKGGLNFRIQAADYFAALMTEFAAKRTYPQRVFTVDDFPSLAYSNTNPDSAGPEHGNPSLIGKPVPLLYGLVSDETSAGADAVGMVPCQFVGRRYIPFYGNYWDEFVLGAHAVKQIQSIFIPTGPNLSSGPTVSARAKVVASDPQIEFLWPGNSLWTAVMGSNQYVEYNGHRYTSVFGFGPRSTLARTGQTPLVANVAGIESTGDSTGTLIDSLHLQILHLLVNFIFGNYINGSWNAPPLVPGSLYSRINTASFLACKVLSETYHTSYFKGAFMLGVDGQALSLQDVLRITARNGFMEYGINKDGQLMASMISLAATLNRTIVDVTDIMAESFYATKRRTQVANTIKYRYAKRYVEPLPNATPEEGAFLYPTNIAPDTEYAVYNQTVVDATSVTKYGERIRDLDLELIAEQETADKVAGLNLATLKNPPTFVGFTERLCGTSTELGSRDTVTHFEGVTASGYTARSIRCETHTLDLDQISAANSQGEVEKEYRDLAPLSFTALEA